MPINLPTNNKCTRCLPTDTTDPTFTPPTMVCEKHESSDGAYEDLKFTCPVCGYYYWIEGADA